MIFLVTEMFAVKIGVARNIMEELFEIVDNHNYNFQHDFQIKRDNVRSVNYGIEIVLGYFT